MAASQGVGASPPQWFQSTRSQVCLVTLVALVAVGLLGAGLLNHFGVISGLNDPAQWSMVGSGSFAGAAAILLTIYFCKFCKSSSPRTFWDKRTSMGTEVVVSPQFISCFNGAGMLEDGPMEGPLLVLTERPTQASLPAASTQQQLGIAFINERFGVPFSRGHLVTPIFRYAADRVVEHVSNGTIKIEKFIIHGDAESVDCIFDCGRVNVVKVITIDATLTVHKLLIELATHAAQLCKKHFPSNQ